MLPLDNHSHKILEKTGTNHLRRAPKTFEKTRSEIHQPQGPYHPLSRTQLP